MEKENVTSRLEPRLIIQLYMHILVLAPFLLSVNSLTAVFSPSYNFVQNHNRWSS